MSVVQEMFSRKRIAPLLLMTLIIIIWYIRKPTPLVELEGVTFGTIAWHIKYKDGDRRDFKVEVDSLLTTFNQSLSHYIPTSEVSTLNNADQPQSYRSPFLYPVLAESKHIYELSGGAFDPAIMPLVNWWGFGPGEAHAPDSMAIDSLREFTDFNLVKFDLNHVWKEDPRVQLDFSAIAKGYGVDVVGHYLEAQGIDDYFVEIGGEVLCKGTNSSGKPWVIGIISPESELMNQFFYATASVSDKAVATSANNFNYRIVDGVRYSHTIDPDTGYPAHRKILSASIFAPDCMTADALATACMVMGLERSKEMIEKLNDVEAFFIFSGDEGGLHSYATPGAAGFIHLPEAAK